jgi:hypothetical protein
VRFHVGHRRFFGVSPRVDVVPVGQMGVMGSLFVAPRLVMMRGFPVVLCCLLVVFSGSVVQPGSLLRHGQPPSLDTIPGAGDDATTAL